MYKLVQNVGESAWNVTVTTRCEYFQRAHEWISSTIPFRPIRACVQWLCCTCCVFLATCRHVKVYGFWPFPEDCNGNPVPNHYWEDVGDTIFSFQHQMELELVLLSRLEQINGHLHVRTTSKYACAGFTSQHNENSLKAFHLLNQTRNTRDEKSDRIPHQ